MNRYPRLSKSGIEYIDYSWGIYSGCHNHLLGICGGGGKDFNCWAQGIAYRFPNHYPNGFEPTYYPEAIDSPKYLKKPSVISVGWVGDVIGYGLDYKDKIYSTIEECQRHTFLFLTKNPEMLSKWGIFPPNCWVGVSACNREMMLKACRFLTEIEAKVKYLSIEPMLEETWVIPSTLVSAGISWVIIGQQTPVRKAIMPKIEWIENLVEVCDKAGVMVFLKDNLLELVNFESPKTAFALTADNSLRQQCL